MQLACNISTMRHAVLNRRLQSLLRINFRLLLQPYKHFYSHCTNSSTYKLTVKASLFIYTIRIVYV
jgi:hypothetical protein